MTKSFLSYNKKNCLTNLLQAEYHVRNMNTFNFIKGEGACVLKHLLFVRGELEEAISHSSEIEQKTTKIFEVIYKEIDDFLKQVEKNKHSYKKRDLLILIRKWRKELEKTMPAFMTFNCKCLHAIPYMKVILIFLFGILWGVLLVKLLSF